MRTGKLVARVGTVGAVAVMAAGLAWPASGAVVPPHELHYGKTMYKGRVNDEGKRAVVVVRCEPGAETGQIVAGQTIGIVDGDHKGDAQRVGGDETVIANLRGTEYTFTRSPTNQPLRGSAPCTGQYYANFRSPPDGQRDAVKVVFVRPSS